MLELRRVEQERDLLKLEVERLQTELRELEQRLGKESRAHHALRESVQLLLRRLVTVELPPRADNARLGVIGSLNPRF